MKTALILIDIQNDYFPGGKMACEGSLEASEQAKRVLASFRQRNMSIAHIQHTSVRAGAAFLVPGTDGVQIHTNVEPLQQEPLFQKHFPNSFRDTGLLEHLRDRAIDRLVIAGMMTHMCVDATTRAAFDLSFSCTVLHDACATRSLSFGAEVVPARHVHASFLAALGAVYAKVISTEDYIAGL